MTLAKDYAISGAAGYATYLVTLPLENLKFVQQAKSTLNDKCQDSDLPEYLQSSAPVFGPLMALNVVKEKGVGGLLFNNFLSPMNVAGMVFSGLGMRISMGIWGFVISRPVFNKDGAGMAMKVLRDAAGHTATYALWFPLGTLGYPDKLEFYAGMDKQAVSQLEVDAPTKKKSYAGFLTFALSTVVFHGAMNLLMEKLKVAEGDRNKQFLCGVVAGLASYPLQSIAERQRYTNETTVEAANALIAQGVPSMYNGFLTHFVKDFAYRTLYFTIFEAVKTQLS